MKQNKFFRFSIKEVYFFVIILIGTGFFPKNSFGQGCTPPATSGTMSLIAGSAACNSMTIRYTNNGVGAQTTRIIIFGKASGSCSFTAPTCNTLYSADTVFGAGTQIGATGEFCVYISSGTISTGGAGVTPQIKLTGMQPGTTYYFTAYSFCGNTTGSVPKLSTTTGGSCSSSSSVFNVQGTAAACNSFTTTGTAVQPITGAGTVCAGTTLNLSSATSGGTWTSNNLPVATVNSSTGVVSGIDPGTATIKYTAVTSPGGCTGYQTATVTVDGKVVAAISGASSICDTSTQTLTDATSGGTWSITSGASITSGGVVTAGFGSVAGTSVIATYSFPTSGCPASASLPITIYSIPPPITGTNGSTSVCIGTPLQLANSLAGGVWSIVGGHATIDATGLVTGTSQGGPDVISYSIGGTCSKTYTVNVYNTPGSAGPISGSSTVCVNGTTTLTNPTSGGKWYITTGAASVDSSTGVVTGVHTGVDTINYSMINGGCAATQTFPITVNPTPSISTIAGGPTSWCSGANPQFTNATSGGTWSSTNTGVATINSSGVVTPVSAGTTNIIYTVTSGGCSNRDTVAFTYTTGGTISDATGGTVCNGSTRSLTASGSGSIQWQLSTDGGTIWNDISGSTSSAYTTSSLTYPNSYKYRAVFASNCPSNVLTLTPINNSYATATGGTACNGSFTMSGGGALTGTWTKISGSGTITAPTSPTTTVTSLGAGNNVFRWTINSGGCITYTDVSVISGAANVSASPSCLFSSGNVTLQSSHTSGTIQWQQSTDGGTTWTDISGATNDNSIVGPYSAGTSYMFRIALNNGICTDYSSTVAVNASYCSTYCSICTSCNLSNSSCTQTFSSSSSTAITAGPTDVFCFTGGTFTGSLKMVGGTIIVYSGATFSPSSINMSIIPSNNGTIEIKTGGTFVIPSGGISTIWSKPFIINNCGTVSGSGDLHFVGGSNYQINNSGTWNATGDIQSVGGSTPVCNSGSMTMGQFKTVGGSGTSFRNSGVWNPSSIQQTGGSGGIYLCPNSFTNVSGTVKSVSGNIYGVDNCATLNVTGGFSGVGATLTGVNICDAQGNTSKTPQVKSWVGGSASNNTYCTCDKIPLPIQLLYFDARMVDKVVKINWITESEINNDHFTIEKTADGKKFEEVVIVSGAGNSTTPHHYHTTDLHPYDGLSYYRLKQTDVDGTETFSKLVAVSSTDESRLEISYFYQTSEQLIYQVTGSHNNDLYIELIDILGRSFYSQKISRNSNEGFYISLPSLSSGIYIFKVSDGYKVASRKFFY